MLPSYTKPNIQSVQPGMTGAPNATPTGYATGANPITASRGAAATMTAAPAMPANPQVQSQPGVPQPWQSQQYMHHMQSMRPEQAGLGSLQAQFNRPPVDAGMTSATSRGHLTQPGQNIWRGAGAAAPVQERTPGVISSLNIPSPASHAQAIYKRDLAAYHAAKPKPAPKPAAKPAEAVKTAADALRRNTKSRRSNSYGDDEGIRRHRSQRSRPGMD